jgi:hypothetical protein
MSQYTPLETVVSPNTAVRKLFANPVLIPGEDASEYRSLEKEVRASLGVKSIIEGILARTFINCEWAIQRWSRVQTALLTPPEPDYTNVARLNAHQGEA